MASSHGDCDSDEDVEEGDRAGCAILIMVPVIFFIILVIDSIP
jgi:hypothetical protein